MAIKVNPIGVLSTKNVTILQGFAGRERNNSETHNSLWFGNYYSYEDFCNPSQNDPSGLIVEIFDSCVTRALFYPLEESRFHSVDFAHFPTYPPALRTCN